MNIRREHIMEIYIFLWMFLKCPLNHRSLRALSYWLSFEGLHIGDFFDNVRKKSRWVRSCWPLWNWLWNAVPCSRSREEKGGIFSFSFLMSNMSDLIEHPFIFEQTLEWMKWPFPHEERWTLTQPVKNDSVAFFRICCQCFDTIVFKLQSRSKSNPVWRHWTSVFVVAESHSVLLHLGMGFELVPLGASTPTTLLTCIERAN